MSLDIRDTYEKKIETKISSVEKTEKDPFVQQKETLVSLYTKDLDKTTQEQFSAIIDMLIQDCKTNSRPAEYITKACQKHPGMRTDLTEINIYAFGTPGYFRSCLEGVVKREIRKKEQEKIVKNISDVQKNINSMQESIYDIKKNTNIIQENLNITQEKVDTSKIQKDIVETKKIEDLTTQKEIIALFTKQQALYEQALKTNPKLDPKNNPDAFAKHIQTSKTQLDASPIAKTLTPDQQQAYLAYSFVNESIKQLPAQEKLQYAAFTTGFVLLHFTVFEVCIFERNRKYSFSHQFSINLIFHKILMYRVEY